MYDEEAIALCDGVVRTMRCVHCEIPDEAKSWRDGRYQRDAPLRNRDIIEAPYRRYSRIARTRSMVN